MQITRDFVAACRVRSVGDLGRNDRIIVVFVERGEVFISGYTYIEEYERLGYFTG